MSSNVKMSGTALGSSVPYAHREICVTVATGGRVIFVPAGNFSGKQRAEVCTLFTHNKYSETIDM